MYVITPKRKLVSINSHSPQPPPQTNIPLDSVLIDLLIQYSCTEWFMKISLASIHCQVVAIRVGAGYIMQSCQPPPPPIL